MSKPGGQSSSSDYWSARDDDNQPANAEHNPHKWAVGTTFEWEFDFPVHPNPAYDHKAEPKRKKKQPAKPAAARTPARKVSKSATTASKPKASENPKRVRLTVEERQERGRARAVEKRSKLKEQGLCRDCQQPLPYQGKPVAQIVPRNVASHVDLANPKETPGTKPKRTSRRHCQRMDGEMLRYSRE